MHTSLARATAPSAEGDIKELLALFPAGREARRVLGTSQRREAGRREKRESSCLSREEPDSERENAHSRSHSKQMKSWGTHRLPVDGLEATPLACRLEGVPSRVSTQALPIFICDLQQVTLLTGYVKMAAVLEMWP